jgi:N-acyl-D-aspartate/D-glutamate deacylase
MIVLLSGLLGFTSFAQAEEYDVVILNGRIIDPETGFDAFANVGISNGWITTITKE